MAAEPELSKALGDPPAGAAEALAPAGVITAAINIGNPVLARVRANGDPEGLSVELARALASWLGASLEMRMYQSAGAVVAAAGTGEWDIAFLAADPQRANYIHFTPAYLTIEASYLVPRASPFESVKELDRDGAAIAASIGAAFALHLERSLRTARLVLLPTVAEAASAYLAGGFDALAGIRPALRDLAATNQGHRVLPDSFLTIEQAIATDRHQSANAAVVDAFVQRAIGAHLIDSLRASAN